MLQAGEKYVTTFETLAVRVRADASRPATMIIPAGSTCLLLSGEGVHGRLVEVEFSAESYLIPAAALLRRAARSRLRRPPVKVPAPASFRRSC